ncbi:Kinesin light chain 4 [Paramyrothecium foliicola]|nr:Kinesin light chain 4 [Paramyrothecium foliicola]
MDFWKSRKLAKAAVPELKRSREDLGLKILAVGEHSTIDLIAVHGLNGHRERTWTAPSGVNWLRDLLPKDFPSARVLTYGYNARTHGSAHLTVQYLYEHAVTFLEKLQSFRQNTNALIHAGLGESELQSIKISTHGIIFFGTPHAGSSAASWATALLKIGSLFANTNTAVIRHLRADSEWLRMQLDQFNSISSDLALVFCYESHKTPVLLGHSALIVPKHSAALAGYPRAISLSLAKNHNELVRYASNKDEDYKLITSHLQKLIMDAGEEVVRRWSHSVSKEPPRTGKPPDKSSTMKDPTSIILSFNPPVEQTADFVGRDEMLQEMHAILCPKISQQSSARILVLYGLGGIGKTQLSLKYAFDRQELFSSMFWVDGSSERRMQLSLRSIAQGYFDAARRSNDSELLQELLARLPLGEHMDALGQLSSDETALSKISHLVTKFMRSIPATNDRPWFMIIDNMDELLDASVSRFIPRTQQGRIIITSRLTEAAQLGEALEVDHLDKKAAAEIILNTARLRMQSSSDFRHAEEIAEALGYLPLALEQAGAFVSQVQIGLDEYLPLLEKNKRQLLGETTSFASRTSIFATLELSFERLQQTDQNAAGLLSLLGYLHHSAVWEGLFTLPFSDAEFRDGYGSFVRRSSMDETELQAIFQDEVRLKAVFGRIMSVSLAKRGAKPGTIYLHPVVHSWARDRLDTSSQVQMMIRTAVIVGQALEYVHRQRGTSQELRELGLRIQPHVDVLLHKGFAATAMRESQSLGDDAKLSLFYIGVFLQEFGRLQEAEEILRLCLQLPAPQTRPEFKANTKLRLASIFHNCSKYDEAIEVLTEAETELASIMGSRHGDVLSAQTLLGSVYHRQFRYDEAEAILRKIMETDVDKNNLFGRHGREAASILGLVYRHKGLLSEALNLLDRALDHANGDNYDMLGLLNLRYRRALVIQEMGRWKAALDACRAVYQDRQDLLGREHPVVLRTANALGRLCSFLGYYQESRELLETAWRGQRKLGFHEDAETAQQRTHFNLGVLDREQGLYNESFERLHKACKSRLRLYGPEAFSTLDCELEFGILLCERGELSEAVKVLRSGLESQMKHYPKNLMMSIQFRTALGGTLTQNADYKEAHEILEPAVLAAQEELSADNPRRLMLELCEAELRASLPTSCDRLLRSMPDLVEKLASALGKHHPIFINAEAVYARILFKSGETKRARAMAQDASNELGTVLGASHPKVIKLLELALSMLEGSDGEGDLFEGEGELGALAMDSQI